LGTGVSPSVDALEWANHWRSQPRSTSDPGAAGCVGHGEVGLVPESGYGTCRPTEILKG